MKIELTKDGGVWIADAIELKDEPPVGRGTNAEEAIGDLVIGLALSSSEYVHELGFEFTITNYGDTRGS
jgi:hypothetical protein